MRQWRESGNEEMVRKMRREKHGGREETEAVEYRNMNCQKLNTEANDHIITRKDHIITRKDHIKAD